MKKFTKLLCLALVLIMVTATFAGCGGGGNTAGNDTTFSWWIYSGADASFYMDYQENPAIQYTLQNTYGPENKSLAFEYWVPPQVLLPTTIPE